MPPAHLAFCTLLLAMTGQAPPTDAASAQASAAAAPSAELATVAEASNYTRTARYADVVTLLDSLAAKYPLARRAEMGKTVEGRSIPMLIISNPPVSSPLEGTLHDGLTDQRKSPRLVVLAIGNIHAGEVDGKEALPILAREILANPDAPENRRLLENLIIIFAPIYNSDGNERFAKGIRGGQNGPEETGIRENAQGFDLNRDFVKLEAPETRALVKTINEWDPAILIDCHITNGSYHRYIVTYAGAKLPTGDPRIVDFTRGTMFPAISADFAARTPYRSYWYGNFNGEWGDQSVLHSRWETFPAEARYGTNYFGLRNRLSVLVETYTYAPFKDRVRATVEFVRHTLNFAASHTEAIHKLLADADADATSPPRGPAPQQLPIRARESPWPEKVTIAGYVEETRDGHRVLTPQTKDYQVELWDKFEPALSVARPEGYIIPPRYTAAVENLRLHGVMTQRLESPPQVDAEIYRVDSTVPASRQFQGHALEKLEVTARGEKFKPAPGSFLVRTGGPLAALTVYLLEPQSEDGLSTWNFFDEGVQAGKDFPVVRVMSLPAELKAAPAAGPAPARANRPVPATK